MEEGVNWSIGNGRLLNGAQRNNEDHFRGIQSLGVKMEEQRKVDIACYQVLMEIQRSLQDLVWKSAPETRSGTESIDGSQGLSELLKEKE